MKNRVKVFSVVVLLLSGIIANAQNETESYIEPLRLSGPRFGVTHISGDLGELLRENNMSTYKSQFGWQFETRWFQTKTGFQGLLETVVLLAGFETDDPVLSGSFLVGFRTRGGFEAGVGPLITTNEDHALVFAIGHTAKLDFVNIPINLAVVPTSDAVKYTILVGFNIRRN